MIIKLMEYLIDNGIKVYLPGQHKGDCLFNYVVLKDNGTSGYLGSNKIGTQLREAAPRRGVPRRGEDERDGAVHVLPAPGQPDADGAQLQVEREGAGRRVQGRPVLAAVRSREGKPGQGRDQGGRVLGCGARSRSGSRSSRRCRRSELFPAKRTKEKPR